MLVIMNWLDALTRFNFGLDGRTEDARRRVVARGGESCQSLDPFIYIKRIRRQGKQNAINRQRRSWSVGPEGRYLVILHHLLSRCSSLGINREPFIDLVEYNVRRHGDDHPSQKAALVPSTRADIP